MNPILQVFYSIISGLLLSLAIPNELYLFGNPIFTTIAFIPLYLAFLQTPSYRRAFLLGFIQTITAHLASSYWLAFFKDFAALTLGASAVGTGFIGGFFGLFLYLPFSSSYNKNKLNGKSLQQNMFQTPAFRIIYFASLYTLYEWVKSVGFLGYPWGTISASMFRWPVLMQLSAITGTYGISFVIMILNCTIAELINLNSLIPVFSLLKRKIISLFKKDRVTLLQNIQFDSNCDKHYVKKVKKILKKEKRKRALQNQYVIDASNHIFSMRLIIKTFSIFLVLILVYGTVEYYKPRKAVKEITTILVQQNSDPWTEYSDYDSIITSQDLTQKQIDILAENNKKAQLVVWSEGCLRQPFPYAETYYKYYPEVNPLSTFIKNCDTPFLLGGSYLDDINYSEDRCYNAALMFDKNGEYRGFYGKNHLVPFAESIPFIEYPAIREVMEEMIGISAGWFPGNRYVFFDIPCNKTKDYKFSPTKYIDLDESIWEQNEKDRIAENKESTVRIATPICFDDAFTDVMRPLFLNGAELFVNITDDSWSLKASSEIQHFAIAAYRAIEYRTTLIRSANAGYSVVVDPSGHVINDQPLFEASSTYCDVPIYERHITPYARFGNYLPYTIAFLFIIYSIYMRKNFKRTDFIKSERKKVIEV